MLDVSQLPPPKIAIFKFHTNPEMLKKWIRAIPRKGTFWATSNNGVCKLHFTDEDLFDTGTNAHGKIRLRSALKPKAVPTKYPNCPAYLSKKTVIHRPTMSGFMARGHKEDLRFLEQSQSFLEMDNVKNIGDLWDKLAGERLPEGFKPNKIFLPDGQFVISIRVETIDMHTWIPMITCNITIFIDLQYKLHKSGVEIPVKHVTGITAKSGIISRASDVPNILSRLTSLHAHEEIS
jgi:hypothetical protein